ncbi:HdeD family acid-resistance protein [Streptacidiphilus monticola]
MPGPLNLLSRAAWQTVLLVGVLSLVLGIIVLVWPKATLLVVGVLFGLYLIVIGVGQLFAAFGTHASTALRVLAFISGSLCILLGLFCFRSVFESLLLLAIWIGIGWLFRGLMQLMAGISDADMPARGWQIFLGVLNAVAGIIVLSWPVGSLAALTLFAGCWLLVIGIFEIATAIQLRSHAKRLPQGSSALSGQLRGCGVRHRHEPGMIT